MQVSKSVLPFLREEMVRTGVFINLVKLKAGGKDKVTRARSIQARMRARSVKFDKDTDWYDTFEEELVRFPRDKHDDQVDAVAYLGLMLDSLVEAYTAEELDEEEYEELKGSGLSDGRSLITGY
jgi:phage terminase large subunit-like protein